MVVGDKMVVADKMVVGDNGPYVAALIAIDPEAFDVWKQHHGKEATASIADLIDDPDLAGRDRGAL